MSLLDQIVSKKPEFKINSQYGSFKMFIKGSLSDIFTGKDLINGEEVVVKAPHKTSHSFLEISKEAIYLSKLQKFDGFPKIYFLQANSQCEAIVIEKLGLSMQDYKQELRNFSLKTVIILALQLLNMMEKMHSLGILHRDIKPSNILSGGPGRESKLYLIDFDIATSLDPNTAMKSSSYGDNFLGTKIFASRNAHRSTVFSKKDDLESLLFTLMYLYEGSLPWESVKCDVRELGKVKAKILKESSHLEGLPSVFGLFFEYLEKLEDDSSPDYNHLRSLFITIAQKYKINYEDEVCEWDKENNLVTSENAIVDDIEEDISIEKKMKMLNQMKNGKFISHVKKSEFLTGFKAVFLSHDGMTE